MGLNDMPSLTISHLFILISVFDVGPPCDERSEVTRKK